MKSTSKKIIIGIGNESRGDDGLGWAFLKALEKGKYADWDFVVRYQLNVEDADLIKEAETVIFVDAYNGKLEKGFLLEECLPQVGFEYTTHALNPCAVLALCNSLYDHKPVSFVMKIQGVEWGLGKGLSERAKGNLERALDYFGRRFGKLDLA